MTMYDMNVTELEDLVVKLKHTIPRNPDHSRIERVELEDAEQLLRERKHAATSEDDIVF